LLCPLFSRGIEFPYTKAVYNRFQNTEYSIPEKIVSAMMARTFLAEEGMAPGQVVIEDAFCAAKKTSVQRVLHVIY
jgi:hypothetical protein